MAYSIKSFRRLFERTWVLITLSRTNKHYSSFVNKNADNGSLSKNFREKQPKNIEVPLVEKEAETNSFEMLKHLKQNVHRVLHELFYCQVAVFKWNFFDVDIFI